MIKRHSVVLLFILVFLGGCHQKQASGLDPRIPAANPAVYESVRDFKDWRNPILMVYSDRIRLMSSATDGGEKTVTLDQLRNSLIELPVSAWPYGRVVDLRSGDDDHLIPGSFAGDLLGILESMDIDGLWW